MSKNTKINFDLPSVPELLKAGVQFGHQTKRWDPKMDQNIFDAKAGIHIIDINRTLEELEKSLDFLVDAASRGPVMFVGTKRQARKIVRDSAIDAGAFFVTHRWVGGLLTNIDSIKRSLKKLADLEKAFEEGVEGRTKFEISKMKKEWERLTRLYEGVKDYSQKPTALVVVDAKYEKNVVREAKNMNIPVVAIVDTNTDPTKVNYPIPGNDDAISALKLYFDLFSKAVKQGNGGKGIKHTFKDYTSVEVEIKKKEVQDELEVESVGESLSKKQVRKAPEASSKQSKGGILETVQKQKEQRIGSKEKKETTKGSDSKTRSTSNSKPKKTKSELSGRTGAALKQAKLKLSDAKKMKKSDLLAVKGIGQKAVEEIKGA